MGRYDRQPTSVMIEVVDPKDAEAHVYRTYCEQMSSDPGSEAFDPDFGNVKGFRITATLGRFLGSNGVLCVLDTEGICTGPITDADPLHVHARKVLATGELDNSLIGDVAVTLFPADIISMPVIDTKNLADFIRKFGHRLECNYSEAREYLESLL